MKRTAWGVWGVTWGLGLCALMSRTPLNLWHVAGAVTAMVLLLHWLEIDEL